jgi:hypothetical protein
MKNNIIFCLCLAGLGLAGSGCSQTQRPFFDGLFQSDSIKQEAIKLDADLLAFKAEQQAQVNTLNKTFQDTSAKLMDQLNTELDLSRDLDAQTVADAAVQDPNKVLMPGAMHDMSLNYINNQFVQIQAVDTQIAAARTAYSTSSKNLTIAVDQLTACDTALKKLIADDPAAESQTLLQDIEGIYSGVKAGISANDKGTGASSSAPLVPGVQ